MKKLQKLLLSLGAVLLSVLAVGLFPAAARAVDETEIMLVTTVASEQPVSNTYVYEITPAATNNPGATGEPTSLEVRLDNVEPTGGVVRVQTALSFAGASYANTGVYRYTVREVSSANPVYPASAQSYEVLAQVTRDANDTMVVQVYGQAVDLSDETKGELIFEHAMQYTYIYVENYVRGLLADRNEYFRYRLEILGPVGAVYTVAGQDATVTYEGATFATLTEYEVKVGDENYIDVYLKDGQTLTVGLTADGAYQIPVGVQYRLVKDKVNRWYTTINDQYFATEEEKMDYLTTVLDPVVNKIVAINERNFDVPMTAVFLNILPFVVLIVATLLGIYALKKVKDNNGAKSSKKASKKSGKKH